MPSCPDNGQVRMDLSPKRTVFGVSQVNGYVRNLLQSDPMLRDISVRGEVSGFTRHSSGHLYFSIKDSEAVLRCACFRQNAQRLRAPVANGMQVVCRGYITLYPQSGTYQMVVSEVAPDGVGALHELFEKTKAKLAAEGLFDAGRKRPLPSFARRVAVITSPTGAVLRDIANVARSRYPGIEIVLLPVAVQGAGAAEQIARALALADGLEGIDCAIVGRGGGSAEDLWPFNEEIVARAVASIQTPVISAVGHETDFSICDFAADVRAATPTHAAQLAVPDAKALLGEVNGLAYAAGIALSRRMDLCQQRLDALVSRPVLRAPEAVFAVLADKNAVLRARAQSAATVALGQKQLKLVALSAKLSALSPRQVLKRGYAIVRKDGKPVPRAQGLSENDTITLEMADGNKQAKVVP